MKLTLDDFSELADIMLTAKCCENCDNFVPIGEGDHVCIAGFGVGFFIAMTIAMLIY